MSTRKGYGKDIIKAKYSKNCDVASVQGKCSDSPCWKAILKVKDIYMLGKKIGVGSGDEARLWKDQLENLTPLCEQYPVFETILTVLCRKVSTLMLAPSSVVGSLLSF